MEKRDFAVGRPDKAVVIAKSYPDGYLIDWHYHDFSQLVYACRGVMTVETQRDLWVIPPQRAVWIPAGVRHKVVMHGCAEMRNFYVRPDLYPQLPNESTVISVTALLRELLLHLASPQAKTLSSDVLDRLIEVTLDQFLVARHVSFNLPVASDPRLRKVCEAIAENPNHQDSLLQWAERANVSSRTLSRLFRAEIGLSFVEYRQQARLFAALILLAQGMPVTRVALEVGFTSVSAFNRLFKQSFAVTPGAFMQIELSEDR
ncbi:AraC family transcriptional regulator [Photobacterium aquae]|uniref:AraC family transcriptional regulator n=1 Tax=Photobacterium aquae TaxID=1195763 RepID=A0A0J1GWQ3_9GAMM|nr:helix-turn-helix transcriptional regulator [Photobacterium aquae]KLV04120.1 AraC family transcriptional regulator [Photobacterium aquae]